MNGTYNTGREPTVLYTHHHLLPEQDPVIAVLQTRYRTAGVPDHLVNDWLQATDERRERPPKVIISDVSPRLIHHCRSLGYHPCVIWYTKRSISGVAEEAIQHGVFHVVSRYKDAGGSAKQELLEYVARAHERPPLPRGASAIFAAPSGAGKSSLMQLLMHDARGRPMRLPNSRSIFDIHVIATSRPPRPLELEGQITQQRSIEGVPWYKDTEHVPDLRIPEFTRKGELSKEEEEMKELVNTRQIIFWNGTGGYPYIALMTRAAKEFSNKHMNIPKHVPCLEDLLARNVVALWATANSSAALAYYQGVKNIEHFRQQGDPQFLVPTQWFALKMPFKQILHRYVRRGEHHFSQRTIREIMQRSDLLKDTSAQYVIEAIYRRQNRNETPLIDSTGQFTDPALRMMKLGRKYLEFEMRNNMFSALQEELDSTNIFVAKQKAYERIVELCETDLDDEARKIRRETAQLREKTGASLLKR